VQYYGQRKNGERQENGKAGKISYTPEESWIGVEIPPILEAELWQAAQARMMKNKAEASRNRKNFYLFSGLITCGICSKGMHGRQDGRNGHTVQSYTCKRYEGGVRPDCKRNIAGARLEKAVWQTVLERFSDPDKALALFLEQGADPEAQRPSLMKREYVEKELRQAQLKLERLEQAYYAGAETPEEYKEKKVRFNREKEVVATKLAALEAAERQTFATEEAKAELWEILNGIARVIEKAQSAEERRHVLNLLRMSIVFLTDRRIEITVQPLEPPVRGVVIVNALPYQCVDNQHTLTWIIAA
jgi:site-specific DNA recombinase